MARHHLFVIAADIKEGCEKHLRDLKPPLPKDERQAQPDLPFRAPDFSDLTMLHYASFIVFDGEKLGATRSRLVLECNIDGSEQAFLSALVNDSAMDKIYGCCEGYPLGPDKQREKVDYLTHRDRLRRPQLFHIGAPHRSVESIKKDFDLRGQLDGALSVLMEPTLTTYSGATLPGIREYGLWDAFSPWAAWIVGILVPALLLWVAVLAEKSTTLPKATIVLTILFCVFFGVVTIIAALKMWFGVVPELRDRVRPWFKWAIAGVIVAIVAYRLRDAYPRWALGLSGLFLLSVVYAAFRQLRQRADQQLRMIRSNAAGPSVADTWKVLRREAPAGDRADWGQRIVNWSIWPVAYGVSYVLIWWTAPYRWTQLLAVTLLFLLKGLWLSVLLGWPAKDDHRIKQDYTRIIAFIIGLPVVAFTAFFVLTGLECPPWLLALVVLLGIFSTWAVPLPSPNVPSHWMDSQELAAILSDEDHGATNHMSAVVVLNQDHRFRVLVLKSFLWLMNRFYFRVVLPDVYRGKLWGIPTVQFAQWVLLDRRNFLFLSNYDNSWTSYLDDFGIQLTTGIQKIWGQGFNNPGTKDLGRFKDYARSTMVRHSYWYRAYQGTLRQVWNNEQIRRAITKARDEEAMMRALRRFGAAKKILPDALHARSL